MSDKLIIPVYKSTEVVAIPISELPTDPTDIIQTLKDEMVPLSVWQDAAITYYKKGNPEAFLQILNVVTSPSELPDRSKEDKNGMISILNILAAYFTRLARLSSDKNKVQDYLSQATQYFNKADKIETKAEITWVGKGISQLFRKKQQQEPDLEGADKRFSSVLELNPTSIPALLGKACILFKKEKYQEALDKYKQVIQLHPNCHPSVRIGMAHCYHKLNKNDLAKMALHRVLDLNPDTETRVDALANLAIFYFNEGNEEKAKQLVVEAYTHDNTNSKILNLLSKIYFTKEKENSRLLAAKAFHNTPIPQIQAESHYYLGRLCHEKEQYHEAEQYYHTAASYWPKFVLPQYALGQMHLKNKETDKAIRCFEKVLAAVPDNYETLRVLGSLYLQKKNIDKATNFLKRAVPMQVDTCDASLELANILETTDYSAALQEYEKAIQILTEEPKPVPKEVWNNIAVIHHLMKHYTEAEHYYRKALDADLPQIEYEEKYYSDKPEDAKKKRMRWAIEEILRDPSEAKKLYLPLNITVTYNLARLYEDEYNWRVATDLYKGILTEYPNYSDCYMRLGMMCKSKAEIHAAGDWFKETISVPDCPAEARASWTCIANLHLDKQEWLPAQKKYDMVLKEQKKNPYVNLQIANIFLSTSKLYPEKRAKYLKVAQDYFLAVLHNDNSNIYAANGLAIVFSELGHFDDAKDFFMQVREATSVIPDVWINLANLNLLQKQYENAIRLYKTCLRDYYNGSDSTVLLYLAKAYFEDGQLEECKKTLQKTIRLQPWNLDLWYNLALTLKENASRLTKNPTTQKMTKAIADYQAAIPIFTRLFEMTTANPEVRVRRSFSTTKVGDYLRGLKANLENATENFDRLKDDEKKKYEDIEQKRLRAEMIVQERLRKREDDIRKEAAAQALADAETEEIMRQVLQAQLDPSGDDGKGKGKGKRGKKKKKEGEGGEEGTKKRKKRTTKKKGDVEKKKRRISKKKGQADDTEITNNELEGLLNDDGLENDELNQSMNFEGQEETQQTEEVQEEDFGQEQEGVYDPEESNLGGGEEVVEGEEDGGGLEAAMDNNFDENDQQTQLENIEEDD